MLSKHERYSGLGMENLVCNHMLSKHERYYGLGMDALVIVCSWSTSGTMESAARMRWTADLAAHTGGRAKVLENPRQNMHRRPTTIQDLL